MDVAQRDHVGVPQIDQSKFFEILVENEWHVSGNSNQYTMPYQGKYMITPPVHLQNAIDGKPSKDVN